MKNVLFTMFVVLFVISAGCTQSQQQTGMQNTTNVTMVTNTSIGTNTTNTSPSTSNGSLVQATSNAKFGEILTNSNGMTLYVFMKDSTNNSACNGGCAQTWPPLVVPAGTMVTGLPGNQETFMRSDGLVQATYNGMPLYTYSGDFHAGDTNGNGIGGVWFVATANMTGFPSMNQTTNETNVTVMTEAQAVAIANNSTCASYNLTSNVSYNNITSTWWIDLNTVKTGCSPACVVSQNGSAEINWRCTGLLTNQSNTNQSNMTGTSQPIPIVKVKNNPNFGNTLTNSAGFGLYVYIRDRVNYSMCYSGCDTSWSPLLLTSVYTLNVSGLPGTLGTITRLDGTQQVTYNGMPLYTYTGDSYPGIISGNGVGNIWFTVTTNLTTFPTPPPPPSYGGGY